MLAKLASTVDRPLLDDGKIPLLSGGIERLVSLTFEHQHVCLGGDVEILFRVGRPPVKFSILFVMPPRPKEPRAFLG